MLRRVEHGEADLIVMLFSKSLGRITAVARHARRSRRRFAGALEPFFTLRVRLEERRSTDLFWLSEASVIRPRTGLLRDLSRLQAGGRALAWLRDAAPTRTPEPAAWAILEALLDRLADDENPPHPDLALAGSGLGLLSALGWGVDFERCVRCGKACPTGKGASVDPTRGGLVCSACGGGKIRISADQRRRLAGAGAGDPNALQTEDATLALDLVERALRAHAGIAH